MIYNTGDRRKKIFNKIQCPSSS